MKLFTKSFAEFLGTLALVFFGCGAAVMTFYGIGASTISGLALTGISGSIVIALSFGLILTVMVYIIGNISGCHINPAVSLAMLINKKINVKEFFAYVGAQILGGIAGAAILFYVLSSFISDYTVISFGLGENSFAWPTQTLAAIIVETFLTYIFVLVCLKVSDNKKYAAVGGIIVGLALTLVHIAGIPLTGTSVNPARSIGPGLFVIIEEFRNMSSTSANNLITLKTLWVFILAPMLGGALAAITHKYAFKKDAETEEIAVEEKA